MSKLSDDIKASFMSVGGEWKKAKKNASNREDRVHGYRLSRMRSHEPRLTLRDAAFMFMEEAYDKASSNGKFYANARQVMYAARPLIIDVLGVNAWSPKTDKYFTQTLLKDYIEENGANMKVVWDARGHLREPHTKYKIGLGGAEVMKYHRDQTGSVNEAETVSFDKQIKTKGPANRYGAVLFIEKEGFDEQLEDAGLAEKWDIAIMSSKGIPNKATCDVGAMVGVPVLVLHDFDLAGFKIVRTLRRGTRLARGIDNLIDIGLGMEDVRDLDPEPVIYNQREDPRHYLKLCGATAEECNFLSHKRVEINMLSTEDLIKFLERNFIEHDVKKVIPDEETLRKAYLRAVFCQEMEEKANEIQIEQEDLTVPDGLAQKISDSLAENPAQSWDEVVWDLADEENKL